MLNITLGCKATKAARRGTTQINTVVNINTVQGPRGISKPVRKRNRVINFLNCEVVSSAGEETECKSLFFYLLNKFNTLIGVRRRGIT